MSIQFLFLEAGTKLRPFKVVWILYFQGNKLYNIQLQESVGAIPVRQNEWSIFFYYMFVKIFGSEISLIQPVDQTVVGRSVRYNFLKGREGSFTSMLVSEHNVSEWWYYIYLWRCQHSYITPQKNQMIDWYWILC